jgi:hypothetical protein
MPSVSEKFRDLCESGLAAGTVSNTIIEEAESTLKIIFPSQYRMFLQEFGAVVAQGIELYGVIDPAKNDPPMWQHVVETTLQLRGWKQSGSEIREFFPISDDGTGVYFYIDATPNAHAEVWAIGPGTKRVVASSLHEFETEYTAGKLAI